MLSLASLVQKKLSPVEIFQDILSQDFLEKFGNRVIDTEDAASQKLINAEGARYMFQLTNEYYLPAEEYMLFNACSQLGHRDYLIVVDDSSRMQAVIYTTQSLPVDFEY